MSYIVGQIAFFNLGQKKENFEFKPVLLSLKIDLVSYHACDRGVG